MLKPNFDSPQSFVDYLKKQVIPDMNKSGNTATSEDFQEAVHWIEVYKAEIFALRHAFLKTKEERMKLIRELQLQLRDAT